MRLQQYDERLRHPADTHVVDAAYTHDHHADDTTNELPRIDVDAADQRTLHLYNTLFWFFFSFLFRSLSVSVRKNRLYTALPWSAVLLVYGTPAFASDISFRRYPLRQ